MGHHEIYVDVNEYIFIFIVLVSALLSATSFIIAFQPHCDRLKILQIFDVDLISIVFYTSAAVFWLFAVMLAIFGYVHFG